MMRIGITGIDGFIGWHLHCHFSVQPRVTVFGAYIDTFKSDEAMNVFTDSCDVIIHLAGLNRGDEKELYQTNVNLVKKLISSCEANDVVPHIIFASSTHIYRDTAYGKSKRDGSILFKKWAEKTGALFTNLILPNVFGESGMPFYNSVVSTFCYQIANREIPEIIHDSEMEQIHAQVVAREILKIIKEQKSGDITLSGNRMTVSGLLKKIKSFSDMYRKHIIPDLRNIFDLYLFNTYRSYLFPAYYPVELDLHEDERGALFESVKNQNGGQTFISTTKPGIVRGNHFHLSKIERFLVIKGQAQINIRKIFSNEVFSYSVSGSSPRYVDMPTMHTHNIVNTGNEDLLTLFWSNEIFDPKNSDTYNEDV